MVHPTTRATIQWYKPLISFSRVKSKKTHISFQIKLLLINPLSSQTHNLSSLSQSTPLPWFFFAATVVLLRLYFFFFFTPVVLLLLLLICKLGLMIHIDLMFHMDLMSSGSKFRISLIFWWICRGWWNSMLRWVARICRGRWICIFWMSLRSRVFVWIINY